LTVKNAVGTLMVLQT